VVAPWCLFFSRGPTTHFPEDCGLSFDGASQPARLFQKGKAAPTIGLQLGGWATFLNFRTRLRLEYAILGIRFVESGF
jgi:hypothetical protein